MTKTDIIILLKKKRSHGSRAYGKNLRKYKKTKYFHCDPHKTII